MKYTNIGSYSTAIANGMKKAVRNIRNHRKVTVELGIWGCNAEDKN